MNEKVSSSFSLIKKPQHGEPGHSREGGGPAEEENVTAPRKQAPQPKSPSGRELISSGKGFCRKTLAV